MLPAAYQIPAAYVLLAGGTIACFAGYRLFKIVLAIYGFIVGALIVSSMMGPASYAMQVGAALAGGVVGALVLVFGYFLGVALVGAGLGALIAHAIWASMGREPHAIIVILFALAGAFVAMVLQRYVIIIATAFGGAWTMIVAALAIMGGASVRAGGVWILYPLDPAPGGKWVPIAWIVLGTVGAIVQLATPSLRRRR
ncbi:MAG TPA: DUF4203 domain-containing protein [Vicinamibacterales bacterium]|jgi:hypothetical protein